MSRRKIERRLEFGHLHRVHRGVYAVGHPELTFLARCRAALLAAGAHTALSHRTAAVLDELLPPARVRSTSPVRRTAALGRV